MDATDEVDFLNIPLECPKCHTRGWTTIHRMHRTFRCKNCGDRFYINQAGDLESGLPPRSYKAWNVLAGFVAGHWARLPRIGRLCVGVTVLLAAGFMLVSWTGRGEPDIPGTLTARAAFIARAIARSDEENLVRVASSRTSHRAAELIAKVRPKSWIQRVSEQAEVAVEVEVMLENARTGKACVHTTIDVRPANEAKPDKPPPSTPA